MCRAQVERRRDDARAIQIAANKAPLERRNRSVYTGFPVVVAKIQGGNSHTGRDVYMPRFKLICTFFALLAGAVASAHADDSAIRQKLVSEHAFTVPTADNTDIVTAGAILVLHKSDLILGPTSSGSFYQNTYKDGRIQPSALAKTKSALGKLGR